MAFFNRKNKDQKKKGESIIGKIIYSCLLFAPLISIFVRCAYVVFNKNAYESYSQASIYQNFVINNNSQFPSGAVVNMKYKSSTSSNFGVSDITYISYTADDLNISQAQYDTINTLYWVNDGRFQFRNGTTVIATKYWNSNIDLNFITTSTNINTSLYTVAYITQTILIQDKLDNVFEYSISKTEESNYYNWAKNTGIYTVLQTTCNGLGITNTITPMIMAYWLIISVIYFIYDIALILIWAVHDKIHELKDAI